jgi:TPR repeat protein
LPLCANADLDSAFKAYDDKQFERAFADFHELAELGSPLAQLNTGLMLTNGEGAKADLVAGYGWILAARDNGSGTANDLAKQMEKRFNAAQAASAQAHVARYGRAGTRTRLFPALPDPGTIQDLGSACRDADRTAAHGISGQRDRRGDARLRRDGADPRS